MKKFSFKAVALAAGLLAGGSAFAWVDLSATGGSTAVYFASERNVASGVTLTNTSNGLSASVKIGVDVAQPAVPATMSKFIRFDLSSGAFTAAPTVVIGTSEANAKSGNQKAGLTNTQIVAGGAGSSYVVFQIDFTALAASDLDSTDYAALTTNGVDVTTQDAITVKYGLYALVGLATAPTDQNALTTKSGDFVKWANALKFVTTSNEKVATYAAKGTAATVPFGKFTGDLTSVTVGDLAITLNTVAATSAVPFLPSTGASAAAITDIMTATGIVTVDGDFSAAKKKADGTLDLASVTFNGVNATTLTATKATFGKTGSLTSIDGANPLVITTDDNGIMAIPVASYTASYDFTGATGFTVADLTSQAIGTVKHDGTTMVAPLVNQPTGWYSRLVLTNNGGTALPYRVSALSESGVTVALTGAAAGGSVAANSTLVVDLPALTTITGAARTGLVVTVDGADTAVTGQYQIVEPTGASISNYTLVVKK